MNTYHRMLCAAIMLLCVSCLGVGRHQKIKADAAKKIEFSLDDIDEHGQIGPPDGKRSVAYIFYIPADQRKRRAVHRIDPRVRFFKRSDQYQCIGGGATREMLLRLASLPFIERIRPFYGE